jgi:hypothetical protein
MVQKAFGEGPAKSLKAEAAKTSNSAGHKVNVLDQALPDGPASIKVVTPGALVSTKLA